MEAFSSFVDPDFYKPIPLLLFDIRLTLLISNQYNPAQFPIFSIYAFFVPNRYSLLVLTVHSTVSGPWVQDAQLNRWE